MLGCWLHKALGLPVQTLKIYIYIKKEIHTEDYQNLLVKINRKLCAAIMTKGTAKYLAVVSHEKNPPEQS